MELEERVAKLEARIAGRRTRPLGEKGAKNSKNCLVQNRRLRTGSPGSI
jgi:hypothetical protein